jgi:hypothetical protein
MYYLSADGQFMTVAVSINGDFKAEAPKPLWRVPEEFARTVDAAQNLPGGLIDMTADGRRFLLLMPAVP